jgi:23S rRNA (cytidine1920-2'-O)/16S rRNA (cytidine1409-2'-O)-methyltransferase
VAARLVGWTQLDGDLVVLVKPQFEAGRREVSRGRGVIRDPEVWKAALRDDIAAFAAAGATMMGVMVSPLRGADGNVEFLSHFRLAAQGSDHIDGANEIDRVVAEAASAAARKQEG